MISMAPTLPPGETNTLHALLELLKDPASAQKRLDDIKAAQDEATKAYATLQTELAAFNQAKAETEKTQLDLAAELERREADITKRSAAVLSAEKMNAEREAMDRDISAKLAERVKDLDAREAAITTRESQATAKDNELSARAQTLADQEAAYTARMQKLKELTA